MAEYANKCPVDGCGKATLRTYCVRCEINGQAEEHERANAFWPNASEEEKLEMLRRGVESGGGEGELEADEIMERVAAHFAGRTMDDFFEATNVVLREAWRQKHGDTEEWDRVAAASGTVIRDAG